MRKGLDSSWCPLEEAVGEHVRVVKAGEDELGEVGGEGDVGLQGIRPQRKGICVLGYGEKILKGIRLGG